MIGRLVASDPEGPDTLISPTPRRSSSDVASHAQLRRARVIDRPQPRSTDYERLRTWLEQLDSRLGLTEKASWNLSALRRDVDQREEREQPFSLNDQQVKDIAEAFAIDLASLVVRPLREFSPYATLISAYQRAGLLGTRKEIWLGHDPDGKRSFEDYTGDTPAEEADRIRREVKVDRFQLAYSVVFQKALVFTLRSLDTIRDDERLGWIGASRTRDDFITAALRRLERLLDGHYKDHSLWSGTFFTGERLDYSQRGLRASTGLLTLILAAPIDSWSSPPGSVDAPTRRRLHAAQGQATGPLRAPLENETLASGLDETLLLHAARWWGAELEAVKPGRARSPYEAAIRAAVTGLRDGLRVHLRDLAKGVGASLDDDDETTGIVALGAQRLAYSAQRLRSPAGD